MEAPVTPAVQTIKPDRILHELSELWTSMSKQEHAEQEDSKAGDGAGVLRACAMTLIVFVDDEDDSMALGETLARLMREHPSRAIVVRLREGGSTLESRVFAQCWMPFGHQRQICCEQVELTASLSRAGDIPSIVSPLAAPDVPRMVWFRSSRVESVPNIGELLAMGDKMIVDSARQGAPAFADLRVLARSGFIVADLSWTRLTKLRELLAQLLHGRDLASIPGVMIEYGGSEAGPEAKYLQAWLRCEMTGVPVELRRAEAPIMQHKDQGQIKAIRIDPDVDVRVEGDCAEYAAGSLHQRANLSGCSEQDLLSEELSIMGHDPVFERALQRMSPWTPQS
jgi:glucose-6-phosphate dehydrogenase assembly protein OpcA